MEELKFVLAALKRLENYAAPDEMRDDCEDDFGLEFPEMLEMAYENIQADITALRQIVEEKIQNYKTM